MAGSGIGSSEGLIPFLQQEKIAARTMCLSLHCCVAVENRPNLIDHEPVEPGSNLICKRLVVFHPSIGGLDWGHP